MMVLRDLLGHSSVLTTEKYLHRLDMTRIYSEARQRYGHAGDAAGYQAAGGRGGIRAGEEAEA